MVQDQTHNGSTQFFVMTGYEGDQIARPPKCGFD